MVFKALFSAFIIFLPHVMYAASFNPFKGLCNLSAATHTAAHAPSAIDSPAIDAPAIDAPVIDAPVIDAPVIDAPVIDAPFIDSPQGLAQALRSQNHKVVQNILTTNLQYITLEEINDLLETSYEYFYVMASNRTYADAHHPTEDMRQILKTAFINKLNATPAHEKSKADWEFLGRQAQHRLDISGQERDAKIVNIIKNKIEAYDITANTSEQNPCRAITLYDPHLALRAAGITQLPHITPTDATAQSTHNLPAYPATEILTPRRILRQQQPAWYNIWAHTMALKTALFQKFRAAENYLNEGRHPWLALLPSFFAWALA